MRDDERDQRVITTDNAHPPGVNTDPGQPTGKPGVELSEIDVEVPDPTRVGDRAPWALPLDNEEDGPVIELAGRFIGFGTSQRAEHVGHPGEPYVGRRSETGEKVSCAACRWFETRLFLVDDDPRGRYLLFNVGETVIPGEQPLYSAHWAKSPYEIIDLLTTIRTNIATNERKTFLRVPARRLLAQAAYYDVEMRDAYEGRMEQL
jgi:hypothetical protein